MSHIFFSFLAYGDSYRSLRYRFRIGVATVHNVIKETTDALWKRLQPKHMPEPDQEMWEKIEVGFRERWQFPNYLGAVDGKHVVINCPSKTGTLCYNYKGTYSINLMALVDWNYRFICVDIGSYGCNADSPVFQNSHFGKRWLLNDLDVPPLNQYPMHLNLEFCLMLLLEMLHFP